MTQKMMIVWLVLALILGGLLGFGFRSPIASALNLNALELTSSTTPADTQAQIDLCNAAVSTTSFLGIGKVFAQSSGPCSQILMCTLSGGVWYGSATDGVCVHPGSWNKKDRDFFAQCLADAKKNGTPPNTITQQELQACYTNTQQGSPRK